jgi:hypothetical protein
MPFLITINGTPIEFPSDADSPDWSAGIIQFAQVVALALNTNSSSSNIPAQVFTIDNFNGVVGQPIQNLAFNPSLVRAAFIDYAVFRQTTGAGASTVYEVGTLNIIFNGTSWEMYRNFTGNETGMVFSISNGGQVSFTNTTITGSNHTGQLSFSATTLLQ